MGKGDHSFASQMLKEIDKRSVGQLLNVPPELCCGEIVDLHRWSLILTDEDLKHLSEQSVTDKFPSLDTSKPDVPGIFTKFLEMNAYPTGVRLLNISNAKDVTNLGLIRFARQHHHLRELNISGCLNIGDPGVREIGINCSMLSTLNLSSCHALESGGLIAIADFCKLLRKLNVSKCRSLQKWGLSKTFYECKKLEEVDISYLKDIGDEEVRVLAQSCPNLFNLTAKETPYISDQAILAVSHNCPDLDYLDVSRTQMSFRISDVCLLALGQRCTSLRVLKVSGCDQISDVGLAWLSEGCKVIEELDLSGCAQITDAGLRSLGNSSHILSSLNISHAKLISDIGLASLSAGCTKLRVLECAGLFQLADPRLSAPKLSAAAAAWQPILGVAAVAKYCPDIEHIDFSGCFRLNVSIQRYVSCLTKLKTLLLSGCPLASESLIAVARNCPLLTDINFSDCGKGVNGAGIKAIASSCFGLKVIILGRCENVKGTAIESLSMCNFLEKLDLSGCRSLTDDMMLPLSRGDSVPCLKFLSLVNCNQVTDATLSWLASGNKSIQHLSIRGTLVRKTALMGVRDAFPNSDVVMNENFFGFWPKGRIEDRALIDTYSRMKLGFVKLQARQRGYIAKERVLRIKDKNLRLSSTIIMQYAVRSYYARCKLEEKRIHWKYVLKSAVMVTAFFRIVIAKKLITQMKTANALAAIFKHITKIQTHWRIYSAKVVRWKLMEKRRILRETRKKMAIRIQCMARMVFGKTVVARTKHLRRSRGAIEEKQALIIQRNFRGLSGRLFCKVKMDKIKEKEREMVVSASRIQRSLRRHWLTRALEAGVNKRIKRKAAAVIMQALGRGFLARLLIQESNMGVEVVNQEAAANTAQYAWRVKRAYMTVRYLRGQRDRAIEHRWNCARLIQTHARSVFAKTRLKLLREEVANNIRGKVHLELWAASKIQALYRGVVGRLLFDQRVLEKKGIWKELFDEEKRKRFFYNKLTGEIRWRMPQDLLDLIPRPKCDNCSFYEAGVECSHCNEFFCSQCWDQVHFGGRRKDHDFRALYDYYGKRLDYGDGDGNSNTDFPCKWPSDVMQDEVHGWMLRVAPTRLPLAIHGAWEEYSDTVEGNNDNNKNVASTRAFYFNRNTFEATYLKPPEVPNQMNSDDAFEPNHFNIDVSLLTGSDVPFDNHNNNHHKKNHNYHDNHYHHNHNHNNHDNHNHHNHNNYQTLPRAQSAQSNEHNAMSDQLSLAGTGNKGYYDEAGNWVYEYDYPPEVASSSFRW